MNIFYILVQNIFLDFCFNKKKIKKIAGLLNDLKYMNIFLNILVQNTFEKNPKIYFVSIYKKNILIHFKSI